jgi:hypothetical protein
MSAEIISFYRLAPEGRPDDEAACSGCGAEPATPDPEFGGHWCVQCAALNSGGGAA